MNLKLIMIKYLHILMVIFFNQDTLKKEEIEKLSHDEIKDHILNIGLHSIDDKKNNFPPEVFNEFLKVVMLRVIDTYWMRHIDAMSELRQGVSLQAYGQQQPLTIYQQEGLRMFNEMIANISNDVTRYAIRAQIKYDQEREAVVKNTQTNQGIADNKPKKPKVRKK